MKTLPCFASVHGVAFVGAGDYVGAYAGMVDPSLLIWRGVIRDQQGALLKCRLRVRPSDRLIDLLQEASVWLIAKAAGLPVAMCAGFACLPVWQLRASVPCANFGGFADDALLPVFFATGDDEYPSTRYGIDVALRALWALPDAAARWASIHDHLMAMAIDFLDDTDSAQQRQVLLSAYEAIARYGAAARMPLPSANAA